MVAASPPLRNRQSAHWGPALTRVAPQSRSRRAERPRDGWRPQRCCLTDWVEELRAGPSAAGGLGWKLAPCAGLGDWVGVGEGPLSGCSSGPAAGVSTCTPPLDLGAWGGELRRCELASDWLQAGCWLTHRHVHSASPANYWGHLLPWQQSVKVPGGVLHGLFVELPRSCSNSLSFMFPELPARAPSSGSQQRAEHFSSLYCGEECF